MQVTTATQARNTLFPLIAHVNDDREPVHITSRAGDAILMPVDDYEAWQTTAYLFASPANARHLLESMDQAKTGQEEAHALVDSD